METDLETFREQWSSVKVTVYENYMVYKVTPGWSSKAATRANDLIKALGLNLIAEGTTIPAKDSFLVRKK